MGALWMLLAGLLFAGMGMLVKLGANHFSSSELVFYRSFFGLVLILPLLRRRHIPLSTPHFTGHLWRGLSGTLAMLLFFHCISVLPLATAITLNYTSALFLTALTLLWLKEHPHFPLIASLALGFLGVLFLLHPTLQREQLGSGLLGLLSGFLAGVALFNVRQLGKAGEPATRIVFYFNLIATLASALWMLLDTLHQPTLHDLPLLISIGAAATLAQIAMTRAYRVGHPQVVSTLSYSTIAFASLFGWWVWHELLDTSAWIGIALITGSGMLSLRLGSRI